MVANGRAAGTIINRLINWDLFVGWSLSPRPGKVLTFW